MRRIARRLGATHRRSVGSCAATRARALPGHDRHALAYDRASPRPAKLAVNLALRERVEDDDLKRRYSPEQIAGRLLRQLPDDSDMWGIDVRDLPVAPRAVARRAASRPGALFAHGRALRRPCRCVGPGSSDTWLVNVVIMP